MALDMPVDEFRRHAHALVDHLTEVLEHPETRRVFPRTKPGEVRSALGSPGDAPAGMDALLAEFEQVIAPSLTQWNHPGFFGFFPNTGSYPAILAELLASALNVNAMSWRSSPAATELEEVATDHLRRLLGLPQPMFAEITDTASSSTLYALAAAREMQGDLRIREDGLSGRDVPRLRVYCSEEAHSSVDKAVATLGLGMSGVRRVDVDEDLRLRSDVLASAISEDRAAGIRPLAVVATVGTTSTTAIDPVRAIAGICRRESLWLHVDAAYGGAAALIPEMRDVLDGCDLADSLVVNPHKWMFVPMDCSVLFCRRPEHLRAAFTVTPEILLSGDAADIDLMDYGIALGRRFRALKLWFVLRYFGAEGMADRLREHVRLAREFAAWVDASPRFERLAQVPLSTVVFRAVGRDDRATDGLNAAILERVNLTGDVFLSHTRVRERYALRVAIGNIRTTVEHVRRAWELLNREYEAAGGSTPEATIRATNPKEWTS